MDFLGTVAANSGSTNCGGDPAGYGAPGTYTSQFSNLCDSGSLDSTCTIQSLKQLGDGQTSTGAGNLTIASGGILSTPIPASAITLTLSGALTVESGGFIRANLSSATLGSLEIKTGGQINLDGKGFAHGYIFGNGYGTGRGGGALTSGAGGSHGGAGGNSSAGVSALAVYGTNVSPTTYGSGGGGGQISAGGDGGGAAHFIVSGRATINGPLTANGSGSGVSVRPGGGGAGGSIWLQCNELAGNSAIEAHGGNSTNGTQHEGGGGGGGRIALQYSVNSFLGTTSVAGGLRSAPPAVDGAIGTLCINGGGGGC